MKTEKIARLNLRWFSRHFHRALRQPEPAPKVVTFGIHFWMPAWTPKWTPNALRLVRKNSAGIALNFDRKIVLFPL
jgi:hypothetical protein